MYIDRVSLKAHARTLLSTANPSPITAGLIYLAITLILSLLSARLLGVNFTQDDALRVLEHIQNGNYDYASMYLLDYMPPSSAYLIDLALELVSYIVSAGFVIFLLNTIRNAGACYGNILDGFGMFLRVIGLQILTGIFVFLWSLLLFIPGIIASYRYRMAIYLLIDHPELSVMECIRESKRMMVGHKMDLFILDLSFLGWSLLSGLAVIGWAVSIYTTPYLNLTYALYYEALCGRFDARQPNDFQGNSNSWEM